MTTAHAETTSPRRDRGSEAVTRGVRVRVRPDFLPEHSDPAKDQFVFGYRIRITNESDHGALLISRRWLIVDAEGKEHEVKGDGVVGQQPYLAPGESFEYASYCPLQTRWGTMEGAFRMVRDDAEPFDAAVARFFLVAEEERIEPGE